MRKSDQPVALDEFDRKILAILQADNMTPQRTIGEAVNLSAPAVQRRIKRLTESGVIKANVAVVDPEAVGQPITIFVEIEVFSETAEQIESAKREFAERRKSSNATTSRERRTSSSLSLSPPWPITRRSPAGCSSATTM